MKILLVAGARPNFMKVAPVVRELRNIVNSSPVVSLEWKLVHTGQHYDYEMSRVFFEDLELSEPDYFLHGGSGSHAEQTGRVMVAFEKVCLHERPDWVVVVGDVNSTLACSVVAKKLGVGVAHVEAGLRSFDMTMPEEINRMVTDVLADLFFVTEQSGVDNLLREGKPRESIHLVGHVMIDNLFRQLERLKNGAGGEFGSARLKEELGEYGFLTLHRPSNVDDPDVLCGLVQTLNKVSERIPLLFPVHPRTASVLRSMQANFLPNVHCLEPLGFLEALFLWKDARMVLTDSGGLQEETTALGIPCLTLRSNTERPITCEQGTNRLVGNQEEGILQGVSDVLENRWPGGTVPPLWDGLSAKRIVSLLCKEPERHGAAKEPPVKHSHSVHLSGCASAAANQSL